MANTELERLNGHQQSVFVRDVAFSPSGNFLATASRNIKGADEVRLYRNAFGGEAIASFRLRDNQPAPAPPPAVAGGPPSPVPAPIAAVSRHGSFVAAAAATGGMLLWKLSEHSEESGARGRMMPDGGDLAGKSATCCRFCPDESVLAYGGSDGVVRLRTLGMVEDDVDTGMRGRLQQSADVWGVRSSQPTKLETPPGQNSSSTPTFLEFSPDGNTLAVAWKNGNLSLALVGTKTPIPIRTSLPSPHHPTCLAFNHDGSKLAATSTNRSVKVVEITPAPDGVGPPKTIVTELGVHPSDIHSCSFSQVENVLAVAGVKGAIVLWRLPRRGGSGWQSRTISHDGQVGLVDLRCLVIGPRGDIIVAGGVGPANTSSKYNSGVICVWDIRSGGLLKRWVHDGSQQVCILGFDAAQATSRATGTPSRGKKRTLADSAEDSGELLSCAVGTAPTMLSVKRWHCERLMLHTPLKTVDGCGAMRSVAFTPDSRLLCCGSGNGLVQTWRTDQAAASSNSDPSERLPPSRLHADYITGLSFVALPLPPSMAGGSASAGTGVTITFGGAAAAAAAAAGGVAAAGGINVPANLLLASSSTDCTIGFSTWVHDLAQWQPAGFLFGHTEAVLCLDCLPDDSEHVHVASGSADLTARVWRARVQVKDAASRIIDVTFQQLASLKHPKDVCGVQLTSTGAASSREAHLGVLGTANGRLVTGCSDGRIRLWNWQHQQSLAVYAAEAPVYSVALWTPVRKHGAGEKQGGSEKDGAGSGREMVAFGVARQSRGTEAQVGMLKVAGHEFQRRGLCAIQGGGVERVRFSPDGKVVAIATAAGQVLLWHVYASTPGLWS